MSKKVQLSSKRGRGRPSVMTDSVVRKLEKAFACDMTDEEASIYAGISRSTLSKHQKECPEFMDRKTLLKHALSMKAKMVIAQRIHEGDEKIAQWWLERRRREEFSLKHELSAESQVPVAIEITRRIVGVNNQDVYHSLDAVR